MKLGLKWIIIFSFSLFKPDYNIAQGAQVFFFTSAMAITSQ